jgi:hypothetical protein
MIAQLKDIMWSPTPLWVTGVVALGVFILGFCKQDRK